MRFDGLQTRLSETEDTWEHMINELHGASFDTSKGKTPLDDESIDGLTGSLRLASTIMSALTSADSSSTTWAALSPAGKQLGSAIANLKASVETIVNQIRKLSIQEVTIRDEGNNLALLFTQPGANPATYNASDHFTQVQQHLWALLDVLSRLLPLCKADGVGDLSVRANKFGELVQSTIQLQDSAHKAEQSVSAADTKSADLLRAMQDRQQQAVTALSKIDSLQQQATKDQATIAATLATVEATGSKAESLEQQVTGFASKFDAFQQQLDKRTTDMEQLLSLARAAEERNETREKEIDRITTESNAMLQGATNVGLSQSLEETRRRYEERMRFAQKGFIVAAVLLALFVIPLAAHLVPGLFGSIFPATGQPETPYTIAGKILLLVPVTWLAVFFARQHAHFFHLEREYGHKAALAKSVDGFRRQSDKWQEEIAMTVFLEIRNNPASIPAPDPAEHPIQAVWRNLTAWIFSRSKGEGSAEPPKSLSKGS
jgi:hypothetical protein